MPVVSSTELVQRRDEILEGARRCFAEHGYEGATVRLLEDAIGKSRGAIFHHFGDKENLFLALARQDAARMADIIARQGLIEVMRDILAHPNRHDWLITRLEISKMLRTDPQFRAKWHSHQQILDQAIHQRLKDNANKGTMRTDMPIEVLHTYLETVLDGFISRLATTGVTEDLSSVLDLVEESIRRPQ
ncbi:TetR/AcrR family transcriptional regulator [Corynebacterium sp. sy017]|uniref:TetR/AcrR family transcriptional regulator n=1 Tax=unclassified Corynebacterium TaxID=2624378 RepID=UPI0011868F6E|nr:MULTISPECIES: TetR/AcrR family transcriptional regulator [unclassified Corynebacterium]MBP3087640.1 TetR/AcrR family transcriptional regulator [Corynebacterium sp. sy017]QDZ42633.1 TetR/AcrR family transcriptional regulator [Corynebacterium sp. sy039]TSD92206.1 TetR/AcrR family transcriptional regulator [Corynebacterium sp. SY003]